MNLIRNGIAVLIAIAIIFISGCVDTSPNADRTPGGQVIPIPIPSGYLQNNSIGSDKLAVDAIGSNLTQNVTGTTISGSTLVMLNGVNGTIVVNRTSALIMTLSADTVTTGANVLSYGQVRVNGVNGLPIAANPTLVTIGNSQGGTNATSFTFYNTSVPAGTYTITFAAATHGNGVVGITNISLITIALPK